MLLQPVSIKFCRYKVDEYCRDSKSYLELLDRWKSENYNASTSNKLTLVAADVQALYPSVRRDLVEAGVREALTLCTEYSKTVVDTLVNLTMYCLENVVVQNGEKFYNQTEGIITGDNHSVSIANITLHHIMLPIADALNKACLFKRYIDDIIWISEGEDHAEMLQNVLLRTFRENGLHLTFRKITTNEPNMSLEFLDVNHVIDIRCPGGFYFLWHRFH